MTGQFAQNNGVRTDSGPHGGRRGFRDLHDIIGPWLSQAGYRTAFTGEYLNHYFRRTPRPPGWSQWHLFLERMGLYRHYDYTLSHNAPRPQSLLHLAVPRRTTRCGEGTGLDLPGTRRDARVLTDVRSPVLRDPAFMEANRADKPRYLRQMGVPSRASLRRWFTRRIQSLQSVDDAVARTVRALRRIGELRNTLIVFTSDNGYLLGEHRYKGKILAYEQALQVPMVMRGPNVPRGVERHLARDPHQLRNVAGRPAYRRTKRELARRTRALADCAGSLCRRRFGPVPPPAR